MQIRMRFALTFFAVIQFFTFFATAHPFVVISTQIREYHIQKASPTHHHDRRQDFFSDIASYANSIFGITDDSTTSTTSSKKASASSSVRTLLPPAVASTTSSADDAEATSTDDNNDGRPTSSDDSSSTESTTTSTEPSTTSDLAPSTTADASSSITTPTSSLGASQPTQTAEPSKSDNSNGVPPGGIAVAVIMSLLIAGLIAWLVFRYHPKCRAWWMAKKEKQFQERSYREAIDGPSASNTPNLRQQALGGGGVASKRQTLKSFFAPTTVKLGGGQEIRRKPVNWGVESPSMAQTGDSEKALMAASAAPMGESEKIPVSSLPTTAIATPAQAVSPATLNPSENLDHLPPVSPLSSHRQLSPISAAVTDRDLQALPPVPGLPYLSHAKKGSDGVFRLR